MRKKKNATSTKDLHREREAIIVHEARQKALESCTKGPPPTTTQEEMRLSNATCGNLILASFLSSSKLS